MKNLFIDPECGDHSLLEAYIKNTGGYRRFYRSTGIHPLKMWFHVKTVRLRFQKGLLFFEIERIINCEAAKSKDPNKWQLLWSILNAPYDDEQ